MKTELVDVSTTKKELRIEIDADTLRKEYDRVSDNYARFVTVPGFRKGRAPRSIVRTRFRDEIRGEVLREIVPQAIQTAVTEKNLTVINEPDVHFDEATDFAKFSEQPLQLHAHFEVMPEIEIGETYKGLDVKRSVRPITDQDVDDVIENLRESAASLEAVEDRAAQTGDTVTVNFEGKYLDPSAPHEAEPVKAEDVDVVLGGEGVLQEFNEQLTGVRPDDVKTFTIAYPEDFTSKGLAGKTIEYTATVTAVRLKTLPDLNDEWVKSLDEEGIETIADLRGRVRERLEQQAQFESDARVRDAALRKLIAAHQFEVPASFVEQQTNQLLETRVREMFSRGIDPRQQQFDWSSLRESLQSQAADEVRASILLERISEQESIDATQAEIDQEITQMATAMRQTEDEVRAALTKHGGDRSIADRLRHRKAIDLIIEQARVTDEEWRVPETATGSDDDSVSTNDAQAETANADSNDEHATDKATSNQADDIKADRAAQPE